MDVRPVEPGDCQIICDIYNYYIENTVISFEEQPLTVDEMAQRVLACTVSYPWLVCVDSGRVVGYAYANRWQVRSAYRQSVETTVYLEPGQQGRGHGKALYSALLPRLAQQGLHAAIAGIALPNEASVRLHERMGFDQVAHFAEVGWKQGKWVDVGYWQKMLNDPVGAAGREGRTGVVCL